MKVKWLGHACFLLEAASGLKIITDPYTTTKGVNYSPINETADIVTVSHDHFDHNGVSEVSGNPEVVTGANPGVHKGIQMKSIDTFHDEEKGSQRGTNTIFCFVLDDIKICHLGDLGHPLNKKQVEDIGKVDLLFIPVGGYFTIDARAALDICNDLKPGIVFPMHYKTSKLDFPVSGVEDFVKGQKNVKRLDSSEIELNSGEIPKEFEIIVLKSAL